MEGLINGFINVALGADGGDREEQQHGRDDRSRSSWAEVVSQDQQDHPLPHHQHKEQYRPQYEEPHLKVPTNPRRWMKVKMDGRLLVESLQGIHIRFKRTTGTAINDLLMSKNTLMRLKLVLMWSPQKMNLLICQELVKNSGLLI
uniref:Uncharacterized protein n=1 Tax=Glycine max TaxID=3847 RepID=C6TBL6_SOYBN|nr:unknown [Glycine max]